MILLLQHQTTAEWLEVKKKVKNQFKKLKI